MVLLKDIPQAPLNPEEVELLANEEFDYADREKVSMREARRKVMENRNDVHTRRGLAELNRVFGTSFETRAPTFDYLSGGTGEFTFREKAFEVAKAGHRGLGNIVKVPGIALKAIGELPLNRAEIEKLKESPHPIQRFRAKAMKSPIGRAARAAGDMLRRAGNSYIDMVNGMTIGESLESRVTREQDFMRAPFYRTSMAVGESVPTYGLAVATTLTTGNPNLGLLVLGTTTTSSAYEKYRDDGIDPDLALIGSVLEGTIEMVTEKVPMDMLMKDAGRHFVIRALRLGTAESFQELLAQLGQNYVDAITRDVDPEDLGTVFAAASQEWAIISQGWQDAMAAGFVMGGGAAAFSGSSDFRTADEMFIDYGVTPRNTGELMFMIEKVRQEVREVEKAAKEELAPAEKPAEPTTEAAAAAPVAERPTKPTKVPPAPSEAKEVDLPAGKEIGAGEEKPRGTSVSVMAQAIENEIVEENKALYDEIPTYRAMNMREQAEKALALIESDVERAKRIAFYQEPAPPDLFPENVFTALRTYAKMTLDVDLIMDLALNEDTVREHTIMGKRIKSLDTDQDYADPVRAIREVVDARKDSMVRKGKDISALEAKFRDLQAELDRTKKAFGEHTKKTRRAYGTKNKIVTRSEYDNIIDRRKKDAGGMVHIKNMGAAYVPNAQDFTDMAKIGMFHLEAMGRDFAKWSYQMTRDFGQWITPHLEKEYNRALKQAEKAGVAIPEAKRLTTKKKRLVTVTGKIEAKLDDLDLAKVPRIPIELDAEGQKLQDAYDLAREKYKAAQAVANIITEEEVRIIAQLAKDAAERKARMDKSKRRTEGQGATPTELEYGVALSMFLEYVNDLKAEANKRTMREVIKNYLVNPIDFISDFAGTLKAAKASLDNSFLLRQGLPTFLKAITGHVPSAKIWWRTFIKSWKLMWGTFRKQKVMRGLFAEMVSDPDYELLKKSKVALNVIEEEIPVDIPSRIPGLGILFRMGENAFVGSARYMRYQLAKQYLNVWRKGGVELNKKELESIGRLANSQTGRGDIASKSQKPGLLNNLFWSPRNLRAYVDILTVHAFDRNMTAFARKQAAINLLRYISGAAMILTIAKWWDDDSVTWDANSADFGKIRIGDTRFSVGGGMGVLVVLASRLVTRKFTSSTTGKTKTIDSRKFGAIGGKDLVFNFVENKLSPASQLAVSIIDQQSWEGDQLIIPQMIDDALTPLIIQNVMETGSSDDAANVLAALIAEAMGVNVQTYGGTRTKKRKRY